MEFGRIKNAGVFFSPLIYFIYLPFYVCVLIWEQSLSCIQNIVQFAFLSFLQQNTQEGELLIMSSNEKGKKKYKNIFQALKTCWVYNLALNLQKEKQRILIITIDTA